MIDVIIVAVNDAFIIDAIAIHDINDKTNTIKNLTNLNLLLV